MIRTAECVSPKHPDKMCDRISDTILDLYLQGDPNSRCAIETCGGNGKVFVTGEVTTNSQLDIPKIVEDVYGTQIDVETNIVKQSNFIAQGVDTGGAGDQGIMVGYACNENEQYIPQELYLARQLCKIIYQSYQFDGKTIILELGPGGAVYTGTLQEDGTIEGTMVNSSGNSGCFKLIPYKY